jgi:Fe-S-cluster containining protein
MQEGKDDFQDGQFEEVRIQGFAHVLHQVSRSCVALVCCATAISDWPRPRRRRKLCARAIAIMSRTSASALARPDIEPIWIAAARELDLRVERTLDAYACSDGAGRILIGRDELLDADDSVAQLIFHELCHALCEGPERSTLPDWGLDNSGAGDVAREHACLRVQVQLASPHGLRALMAPTTEHRAYHDRLPVDPLRAAEVATAGVSDAAAADDQDRACQARSIALARGAIERAQGSRWGEVIDRALALTALRLRSDRHPLGFAPGPAGESCGGCAWMYSGGRGKAVLRCRQSAGVDGVGRRTAAELAACERWEPPVNCHQCGACCREAYHSVTVSMRDPVVWRQPALVVRHGHRFEILREGDRCAALEHDGDPAAAASNAPALSAAASAGAGGGKSFSCSIYDDRPQACRDFEAGGRHCLDARRRVGLSR